MADRTITIGGPKDKRIRCPIEGCRTTMVLHPNGIQMMLDQQTKCREHDLLLVVVEP